MTLIIDEMLAQIEPAQGLDGGGTGEPQPAEGGTQSLLDLLALTQERKARLVVD